MNFLYPGFLISLAAVAIPIIIHLFNFRKFRKIPFSNVRFLKQIEQKNSSFQQLKNRLILAARILVITFLVFAFAKPYVPEKGGSAAVKEQLIGIYIDNSFSMEAVNQEGALLESAKRRAKEIASIYNPNDRFLLLTNDFEGKHQRLLSSEDLEKVVDDIRISPATRKLRQVFGRMQESLSRQPSPKTVYFISDFQKNMLGGDEITPDPDISVRFIRLQANSLANISVDSLWFISPVHKPGGTEKIVVQLKNNSDKASKAIPVKLFVNKQPKAIGTLTVGAREIARDTLSFSGLSAGWQQGEIQITDYPLVFDDKFFFAFQVRESMPVLVVNESIPNPYIQAVYRADPFFKLDNAAVGNINYASLKNYQLIILNSLTSVSTGLAEQLAAYVKDGGHLMVFPSLSVDINAFKSFLQAFNTDIPEQLVHAETKLAAINLSHPIFQEVFEQVPRNLDLPHVKAYFQYSTQSKTTRQRILDLPGQRSFLSQYNLGKGKIYLSAVPLDEQVTNFAQHAVFVPVMYRIALLSLRDNRLFYTLGGDQFLETTKTLPTANQVLKLKKEGFETIPDMQQTENATRLFIADQIREEGAYRLFKGDSLLGIFAFNNNRTESDLSYAGDKEIQSVFPKQKIEIFTPGKESVHKAIKTADSGIQLWKLCIILSLLFIAAEVLLVRLEPSLKNKRVNGA